MWLAGLLGDPGEDDLLLAWLLTRHSRDSELVGRGQNQLTLLVVAGKLRHGSILTILETWLLDHLELTTWHLDHLAGHALGSPWLTHTHAMHGCSRLHGLPGGRSRSQGGQPLCMGHHATGLGDGLGGHGHLGPMTHSHLGLLSYANLLVITRHGHARMGRIISCLFLVTHNGGCHLVKKSHTKNHFKKTTDTFH